WDYHFFGDCLSDLPSKKRVFFYDLGLFLPPLTFLTILRTFFPSREFIRSFIIQKGRNFIMLRKAIINSIFAITIAILVSGCAMHSGYMLNSAALGSANFSYVRQNISGETEITYFLGFGGIDDETLVDMAKRKMLGNHPLKSNQALANLTVNFKSSYYLGWIYYKI